jgi:drug/metabolite transporter (DMT)-like permease
VIFLKEKVGPRRRAEIGGGLLGVFAILRPGAVDFDIVMLLPIAASLCWAGSLIITRAMKGRETALAILVWSTMAGLVVIAPMGFATWRPLEFDAVVIIALLAVFHLGAQTLVIQAFTLGAASLIAPFAYVALVWATLIGYPAFDNMPDAPAFGGAAILIGSGIYVWQRERAVAAR